MFSTFSFAEVLNNLNLYYRSDTRDYALKQIEGTGLSMSACREIAVSIKFSYIKYSVLIL
jgi:hypothetical protein